ncbi:vitamin K epoxide reductase family protein [Chitinophaga niastensis]|uniref:Vitamin K epoxide reductase family protein n=1 Tax=Chitinophaga niastensis TaxID=536980 RepID=A0A2P8HJH2_CHINA|nr:vitamin K epoxide reductase family protein [Chitinophaga niastensis]PSL46367.1 vitamin K epoxide reductase family protein [Chitinophaga niastensis]
MKTNQQVTAFEEIAYNWLRKIGIKVNKNFIFQEIKSHPDYPSLVSLIDFLDMGKMNYRAIESNAAYISQFTYPCLAHIKEDDGKEYMLQVDGQNDWRNNKLLKKNWTGIVLFADDHPSWSYEENTRLIKESRSLKTVSGIFFMLLLSVFIYVTSRNFYLINAAWGLLAFTGLMISIAAISVELGMQIKAVKEVCNAVSASGCDAVLRSSYAKGIAGISIADFSLSYFVMQSGCYVLSHWHPALLHTALLISVPVIVIAGLSLYAQQFLLKKWCVICLGIVAVILAQSILAYYAIKTFRVTATYFLSFFIIQVIVCYSLLVVKKFVKNIRERLMQATDLLRWKKDESLYTFQAAQRPYVDCTTWEQELLLGDDTAPVQITIACNPYCGPCAIAHKIIDELYATYNGILCIKFRFLFPYNDPENGLTLAVKAILQKAGSIHNNGELSEMLSDWFEWMDLEKWQQKWGPVPDVNIDDLLKAHIHWMDHVAQVKGTPTFFINGRQLPRNYVIRDMFQLIPSLAASFSATVKQ